VIFDKPSRRQPTPRSSFNRDPAYLRESAGSMPALPGGTSIGMVYSDVPCSETLNAPFSAPTWLGGG